MPTENINLLRAVSVAGTPILIDVSFWRQAYTWNHSPKVKGKLMLRGNGVMRNISKITSYRLAGPSSWQYMPRTTNAQGYVTPAEWAALETASYARLRGKLYKGSAALGVTIGSYKESREMISARYRDVHNKTEAAARILQRIPSGVSRKNMAQIGGVYLEYLFGVVPLYEDILAATTTVCQLADRLDFVRAGSRAYLDKVEKYSSPLKILSKISGEYRVVQAAGVRIGNPNLWLAERAGLLNLGSVAWDLVPWSFVVNWFVNVNTLVQQVTDFVGLQFDNVTVTRKITSNTYYSASAVHDPMDHSYLTAREVFKSRTVGNLAKPSLQFRLPEVNWDLAAIAASLATQKLAKLQRLSIFRPTP